MSIFMSASWKRLTNGGLNVISTYGPKRRLQGLSGVGIDCISEYILKLYAPFLVASLGGS